VTRIIAGAAGGRRLATLPGDTTRPTTDRVRESLFSSLESAFGGLSGLRVLDLFAGSGALGLEAASRGAAAVDLVEKDARAATVVQRNVATVRAPGVRVHRVTAERFVASAPSAPYDLVLLDPPYALPHLALADVLAALKAPGWLADDALVVVERSSRDSFTWPDGFEAVRDKTYGETRLWYGR
jgi:16S rRNA (guanine966-N2)-methyltransferase